MSYKDLAESLLRIFVGIEVVGLMRISVSRIIIVEFGEGSYLMLVGYYYSSLCEISFVLAFKKLNL